MNPHIVGTLSLITWVIFGSFSLADGQASGPATAVESVFTDLRGTSCSDFVDPNDPNDTHHWICPGVSGYHLIVRQVGSGRKSIDVVSPTQGKHPLDLHALITQYMFQLQLKAEWRVMKKNGKETPIALMVGVQAHEDEAEPERVTNTYLVLAKITTADTCVTDRIPADSLSATELRRRADSVAERPCLESQQRLIVR